MRFCLALLVCLSAFVSYPGNARAEGRIYLIKGLANIFSTGLNTLNEELVRRGYDSTVHSHVEYKSLADEAAKLQKSGKGPIVIIGHSLGADAAVLMARSMGEKHARVALLVLFGPDYATTAPANVSQIVNYHGGGAVVTKGTRFSGSITNINLDTQAGINHFNVEKVERFHASVIARIQKIMRGSTRNNQ